MNSHKCLLSLLPLELKLKICSFMNTYDILELSRALPDFEFCTFEKKLSRFANLYKEYRIKVQDLAVICKGLRGEFITYLNINCVYWIPLAEIKRCVANLTSLECFYAVDTKLSLTSSSCFHHLLNLKRIALSFDGAINSEVFNNFPRAITHFYLHISKSTPEAINRLSYFMHNLTELKELWIMDYTSTTECISMRILSMLPKNIIKHTFFVQSFSNIALIRQLYISNGITTFRNRSRGYEVVIEKNENTEISNIYSKWTFENETWNTLINFLKAELPFCEHDAKLLIQKKANLENIKFRELNLSHSTVHCSQLFKSTVTQLLMEPNVEQLKKLSINLCFLEVNMTVGNKSIQEPLFKRNRRESRINPKTDDGTCILDVILNSCPYIEELELWECRLVPLTNVFPGFLNGGFRLQLTNVSMNALKNFTFLRKLTLDGIPTHISGSFLVDVCKYCTNLESLRIKISKQNSNMNNYICLALTHAQYLKDFRYENVYIPIDKIFDSLSNISKLGRLVIKCKSVQTFSSTPFNNFFGNNLHLKFLCIIITEMPKVTIRNISKVLSKYMDSPEKIFIITHDDMLISQRPSIPDVHKYEMLYFYSQICTLDLFNGFSKME